MASLALKTSSGEILGFLLLEEVGPLRNDQKGRCMFMGLPVPANLNKDPLLMLIHQFRQKPMAYAVAEASPGFTLAVSIPDGSTATLELNGDGQGTVVVKKDGSNSTITGHCELSKTA